MMSILTFDKRMPLALFVMEYSIKSKGHLMLIIQFRKVKPSYFFISDRDAASSKNLRGQGAVVIWWAKSAPLVRIRLTDLPNCPPPPSCPPYSGIPVS